MNLMLYLLLFAVVSTLPYDRVDDALGGFMGIYHFDAYCTIEKILHYFGRMVVFSNY